MCKRVHAKKGEVLTTPGMLEDYKKKPRHSKQKKKKKKNQDDTACNINCTLWKKNTKQEMWLIFDTCEIIMYAPNGYQQTQIQTTALTVSNVQTNIKSYVFVYVNVVHIECRPFY